MKKYDYKLFDLLLEEYNKDFKGWDFSYLQKTGRMVEFPLTWNYRNIVLEKIKGITSLLDMGTGGGEFLYDFDKLPKETFATEGYEPNLYIAKQKLKPLGIEVRKVDSEGKLPFSNNTFDVVINRHESYSPREVKRILKDKGLFITQQVGSLNDKEFLELFEVKCTSSFVWNLNTAILDLIKDGYNIKNKQELITKTRFYDIGSIVYYLKSIPWIIEDFSIERYYDSLFNINNIMQTTGYIDFTCHRFIIIAQNQNFF